MSFVLISAMFEGVSLSFTWRLKLRLDDVSDEMQIGEMVAVTIDCESRSIVVGEISTHFSFSN